MFLVFFSELPTHGKADGWASGVTDSPNGNASSRFCLMSDWIPQPDNMFISCFSIFFPTFIPPSCIIHPQPKHIFFIIL